MEKNPEVMDQAAILLRTLNSAIQNGLDELPAIAQISIDAIGAYYAGHFFIALSSFAFGIILISIGMCCLCLIKEVSSERFSPKELQHEVTIGTGIGFMVIGAGMSIIGFIGIMVTFASYLSPLGKILVDKL